MTVSSINQVPLHDTMSEAMNESLPTVPTPSSESGVKFITPSASSGRTVESNTPHSSETGLEVNIVPSSETGVEFKINPSSKIEIKSSSPLSSEDEGKFVNQNTPFGSTDIRFGKSGIKKLKQHQNKHNGNVKKKV